ncbi:hypothetical protein LEP1GSC036_2406 [Leptospira weilii str. 2006001853]|uniref:Uncharacterized protein n=1 Tax=Leptospira weilii str. 2006001853 TaxID=1001589 RepID=A0A828YYQ2_9LEPT|nr:hypothetical protein LEP1GSC036_2406 [Leptospira weilii str. 2006001853]
MVAPKSDFHFSKIYFGSFRQIIRMKKNVSIRISNLRRIKYCLLFFTKI